MTEVRETEMTDDPWHDAQRVESFAGEIRINRIRLIGIIVFYARHLIDVYMLRHDPAIAGAYHSRVTGVVVAWALLVAGLHWMLSQRRFDPSLKYIAVIWDLVMVTLLGVIAGPRHALVVLFFVVIATAPLRLSLKLVWVATVGAWIGYSIVLMWYAWVVIGWHQYYSHPELRIPRSQEAIFILALGAAGLCAGQSVRQMRRLVAGHAVVLQNTTMET
jgi:hypothetical protein